MSECKAAANIKGEHIPCELPNGDDGTHRPFAHSNREHEIIWQGSEANDDWLPPVEARMLGADQ